MIEKRGIALKRGRHALLFQRRSFAYDRVGVLHYRVFGIYTSGDGERVDGRVFADNGTGAENCSAADLDAVAEDSAELSHPRFQTQGAILH